MTDAGFLIARRRHSRRGRSRPQACVGGMRAAHCLSAVGPRRITWLFSIATLLGVCRCGGCHSGVRLISQRVWPCVDVCQRCDGVAHAPKRITRMHRCWCKAAGALCCSTACAHSSTTPANLLQTGACVRVRACVRACVPPLSVTNARLISLSTPKKKPASRWSTLRRRRMRRSTVPRRRHPDDAARRVCAVSCALDTEAQSSLHVRHM